MENKKEIILGPQDFLKFLNSDTNEQNCLYRYESEAFHFSCIFEIDSKQNIGIVLLNDYKFDFFIKQKSKQEDIEFFLSRLLVNYGFMPELYRFKNSFILEDLNIKSNYPGMEMKFNNVMFYKKSIYLVGVNKKGKDYLKENYYENHFFDLIKKINFDSVSDIDLIIYENIAYMDLFLKSGECISMNKIIHDKEDLEAILNFKINIKSKINYFVLNKY